MLKILFNIFLFYAIWQIIRMFFSVKKVQENFQQQVNDLNRKVNQPAPPAPARNKPDSEGEYIDYEEIK